jgi:soluble lytic murein transglycosylase-like protein
VFVVILAVCFSAGAASAQEKTPNTEPQAAGAVGTPKAVKTNLPAGDSASRKTTAEPAASLPKPIPKSIDIAAPSAADDYKRNLTNLEALYQGDVLKLGQKNDQLKGLYRDGIIARAELVKSDQALADARAKVEEVRNQIAEANKPGPIMPAASAHPVLSDTAWSTGNNKIDTLVRFYGNKYGVDPYLIFCLMHQESRFTSIATSSKGAQGLMQLMPGTAARYGVRNPYDAEQSIMGGTRYLKDLLQMFNGRIDLALAGYNAGENAVIKHGYAVPPYQETRNYVRLIIARYAMKPAS